MAVEDRDALADLADIHRVLAGDSRAFRPIVERYADRVLAFCRSRRLNEDEAADLVQDVFLRAFRSLGSFRLGESFPSWLFAIAANRLRSRGAKRSGEEKKVEAVAVEEATRETPDALSEAEKAFEAEEVRKAVASLPADQRSVVELYYFAELSVAEVTEVLGIGEEAVKSRLFRARKKLRSLLESGDSEQPRVAHGGIAL